MLEEISVQGITGARDRFLHGDLRARLRAQHGDHVDDTVLGWTENWLRPEFRDWDIRPRLRAVRCPVLIIQGRDDDFGTLGQVDAIAARVGGPGREARSSTAAGTFRTGRSRAKCWRRRRAS